MTQTVRATPSKLVTIYDDIYDLPDSRDYFRAMHHAGFRTAHHAAAAFRAARNALMQTRGQDRLRVLDFASGYGIAALLMRHDVTLDAVLERYAGPALEGLGSAELAARDATWLRARRDPANLDIYGGTDIAANALAYGRQSGVFDAAFAADLDANAPAPDMSEWLKSVDLVVEIGSIAHMLPGALDRVLSAAATPPWVITAPIRGNDSAAALEVLARHGLETEVLDVPPFRHRRFADADEQARAIANARARGHDTDGFETTGYFHAQLFLSRPAGERGAVADWALPIRAD